MLSCGAAVNAIIWCVLRKGDMADASCFAFGAGLATLNSRGECIEVYYPAPQLQPEVREVRDFFSAAQFAQDSAYRVLTAAEANKFAASPLLRALVASEALRDPSRRLVLTVIRRDGRLTSVAEAYLKLHLLSHRLVKPNTVDLRGIFKILPTVAWTSAGAIDGREIAARLLRARLARQVLHIFALDKFPPLLDYVVPAGVRIADTARVRLGAYLGEGTTVMPAGFINFNAGTVGPNMVEGRVSQGVVLAAGSDLGGGASTMGTLSGGNDTLVSVGRNCLIGANAGIGIALGDNCTVEAGLYVTAGTKVVVREKGRSEKAANKPGEAEWSEKAANKPGEAEWSKKAANKPGEAEWSKKAANKPGEAEWSKKAANKPGEAEWSKKAANKPGEAEWSKKAANKPGEAEWSKKAANKPGEAEWSKKAANKPGEAEWSKKAANKPGEAERSETVHARTLSGRDGMLLRRNSQHGYIECLPNHKDFALRAELHE